MTRLGAAANREQRAQVLLFLFGYASAVFDAALDAVESCGEEPSAIIWRPVLGS